MPVRVSSELELRPSAGVSSWCLPLALAPLVTAGVVNEDEEEEEDKEREEEEAADRGLVSSLGGGVEVWSCWKSRWISASERVSDCSPCWWYRPSLRETHTHLYEVLIFCLWLVCLCCVCVSVPPLLQPLRHSVAQQRPLVLLGRGEGGGLGAELSRRPPQPLLLLLQAAGRRHVTLPRRGGGGGGAARLRSERAESERRRWEEPRK